MVHQNPLAYLLGLEGVALLRAFAGEYDRDFTEARLAEIRELLDPSSEVGRTVEAQVLDVAGAYRAWAGFYDQPGNAFFEREQSFVWDIVDALPRGVALDAACGTGRHAEHLAALGHRVIGVDLTPKMLDRARARVPSGEFHVGDLRHLPLPDDHVDVVVCALALTHVSDLGAVFAEFARVLRPGGHLVISDARGLFPDGIRSPLARAGSDGGPAFLPETHHPTSAYLSAALPLGLEVRRCEEPVPRQAPASGPDAPRRPASASDVAALNTWCPEAARAAYRGLPDLIIWHFQLTAS